MGMVKTLLPFSVTNKQTTARRNNNFKKSFRIVARLTDNVAKIYKILIMPFITMFETQYMLRF